MDPARRVSASAPFIAAAAIAATLVGMAFLLAPRACEGGLERYFLAGCVGLVLLLALPFATRLGRSPVPRIAWSLCFVVLGVLAWVGGLLAANMRFICGLGYL